MADCLLKYLLFCYSVFSEIIFTMSSPLIVPDLYSSLTLEAIAEHHISLGQGVFRLHLYVKTELHRLTVYFLEVKIVLK